MNDTNLRLDRINQKGMAVAQRLMDLMAGKDVDLSELGDLRGLDLIDSKEMRLRAFLDQINRARKRLSSQEYGLCVGCQAPLEPVALDETPWMEGCGTCANG